MAVIGQVLTTPEAGWNRYDDTHPAFKYVGNWLIDSSSTDAYGSKMRYTTTSGDYIEFKFTGTKIRLLSSVFTNRDDSITIEIDGESYTFSENFGNSRQILVYEKLNLSLSEHVVKIKKTQTGTNYVVFDAIDIDSTGRLFHPDEVTDPKDLAVGKRIRCNYTSKSQGDIGAFSQLGQETKDFIPVTSSATPDGDFYYICVDKDYLGRWKLIADRNLQHTISWDSLNTAGVASGSGMPTNMLGKISSSYESTTGNWRAYNAFNGSNAEWANYGGTNIQQGWLSHEYAKAVKIIKYTIIGNTTDRLPKNFSLNGSNDGGVTWTTLDSQTNVTNWVTKTKKEFNVSSPNFYKTYKLNFTDINGATSEANIGEIELIPYEAPPFAFTTRLLTGGTTTADKDNEWDKYIVNSTLGGAITAGDNNVWNWSGIYSWGSTSTNTYRIAKGSTAVGMTNAYLSSSTGVAFRPVLLIESIFVQLNKSFILLDGKYKKFGGGTEGIPERNAVKLASDDGNTIYSSQGSTGYEAWKAFDGMSDNYSWVSSSATGYIGYKFAIKTTLSKYRVASRNNTAISSLNSHPSDWTFEGSNDDGLTWIILDTQKNQTGWTATTIKEFLLPTLPNFKWYRLNITLNNGGTSLVVGELELVIPEIPATPSTWQTVSATLPSLDTFKGEGIDDLSVFDRKATALTQPMTSEVLGAGKLMKSKVDLNKYFNLNSLNVK